MYVNSRICSSVRCSLQRVEDGVVDPAEPQHQRVGVRQQRPLDRREEVGDAPRLERLDLLLGEAVARGTTCSAGRTRTGCRRASRRGSGRAPAAPRRACGPGWRRGRSHGTRARARRASWRTRSTSRPASRLRFRARPPGRGRRRGACTSTGRSGLRRRHGGSVGVAAWRVVYGTRLRSARSFSNRATLDPCRGSCAMRRATGGTRHGRDREHQHRVRAARVQPPRARLLATWPRPSRGTRTSSA